jgi:hypothetical protein
VGSHLAADGAGGRVGRRQDEAVRGAEQRAPVLALDAAVEKVHRRGADEAGHELVVGIVVKMQRRADLLDDAVMHDDDLVGHRHRLDLVVGDIDGRRLEALVQLLDLAAHRHAQLRVEIGQRLVEQEDLRIAHDGAAHGDALALAAGERAGIALQQLVEAEDARGVLDALVDLALRRVAQTQREGHVLRHRHMRVERVLLEHHGDVALFGRNVVDDLGADGDLPARDAFEPGEHAQQGGLSASRGTDQNDEFAVLDLDVDAVDHLRRAVSLFHVPYRYGRHGSPP